MGQIVFKILSRTEWIAAVCAGKFAGSADDRRDGYIHLSTAEQVAETAARHFRGQGDLVIAAFRADALGPSLRWERSRGGRMFPHLYGSLDTNRVEWVEPVPLAADGIPRIPERASAC